MSLILILIRIQTILNTQYYFIETVFPVD